MSHRGRRYDGLWDGLISFANLSAAADQARRGKRSRPAVMRFEYDRERELWRLHEDLRERTYQPGPFRSFEIRDPKPRLISAAPYRDRVVHHALCNILTPIFERSFIHHSYGSRAGKGTHAAVRHASELARHHAYVLKCDIEKYFPSMDHEILKGLIRRKVKDAGVLWLVDRIIDRALSHSAIPEFDSSCVNSRRHLRPSRALPVGLARKPWGRLPA